MNEWRIRTIGYNNIWIVTRHGALVSSFDTHQKALTYVLASLKYSKAVENEAFASTMFTPEEALTLAQDGICQTWLGDQGRRFDYSDAPCNGRHWTLTRKGSNVALWVYDLARDCRYVAWEER